MDYKKISRYLILGILFFLPVTFLLFLYPATHNYSPLDIVNKDVLEVSVSEEINLEDHITVLAFFGKAPMERSIAASNLKELVYDKFKGFKKFQIIVIVSPSERDSAMELRKEIRKYDELKFWHFVYASDDDISEIFNSLLTGIDLDEDLSTNHVFIIDKELNQRGRIDDRTDNEIEKNKPTYKLTSYDCIEVAEIKNKMSDDLRILFTEYRQKRKGEFKYESSRTEDITK